MTATVDGAITNRIKVQRVRRKRTPAEETNKRAARVGTPRPPMTPRRGRPYRVVCISVYLDDLARIDLAAAHRRMSRSEFLRWAANVCSDAMGLTAPASLDGLPAREQLELLL